MFLIPGTSHAITWSKQNLLDDTTYYVRAVVRDVRTETVLDTIDLDSLGGGRYSAFWNVAQDPTGQGREIEIERTIYEDSGYTQVSGIYGRWLERYTILALLNFGGTGGRGTSVTFDYKYIINELDRRQEARINQLLAALPKQEKFDLSQVMVEFGDVKKSLKERLQDLLNIETKAKALQKTEERIIEATNGLRSTISKTSQAIEEIKTSIIDRFESAVSELIERMLASVDAREQGLTSKTDAEFTHIVSQFKKIMDSEAEKIAAQVVKLEQKMNEPLHISLTANRDQAKTADTSEDARVKRLASMSQ